MIKKIINKKIPKIDKSKIYSIVNICLILFAVNLIFGSFFIADQNFIKISLSLVFISIVLFNISFDLNILKIRKLSKISYILFLLVLPFILLIFLQNSLIWMMSIPILISGLFLYSREKNIIRNELKILLYSTTITSILFIFIFTIPILWYFFQQISLYFTSFLGSISFIPLFLGPSISGLWIVISFFIFNMTILKITDFKKKDIFYLTLGFIIIWTVVLIIYNYIGYHYTTNILNHHFVLFILYLIYSIFFYLHKEKSIRFKPKKIIKEKKTYLRNAKLFSIVFIVVSILLLNIFIGAGQESEDNSNKKVMFYGKNILGNFNVPAYGSYGAKAQGMYGLIPNYLKLLEYETDIIVKDKNNFIIENIPVFENITNYVNITDYVDLIESKTITDDLLKDIDVFIIISINKTFSSDEFDVIWDYVRKGGSLLVLGDHTNIGDMQEPLNNLLEPVGISYRFDSGIPYDNNFKWEVCSKPFNFPATYDAYKENELGISVGASLDTSYNSFPVIVGQYGLSDIGDYSNSQGSYLGDYKYNPGEQYGDIVLGAAAYYGNGKIFVFGDTSSFQNGALSSSFPLIKGVFRWLNSSSNSFTYYSQIILSIIILSIGIIIFLRYKNQKIHFPMIPILILVALLISSSVNILILNDYELNGKIAYIDFSHVENINSEPYQDKSVSGLELNLMRNSYLPLHLTDFSKEKIRNSEIFIINEPTKSITEDEVKFLKGYMEDGGLVIITTSYSNKESSMPLLNEFGLDVIDLPLGPVPYNEENIEEYQKEPRFVDAWPSVIKNSDETEIFYSFEINQETYVLMTFSSYGKGGLLFISDAEFLTDKNIESNYDYWPGNIQFLKNIIDEFTNRGVLN